MLKILKKIVILMLILMPFRIMAYPNITTKYIDNVYSNRIEGENSITGKFGYIYVNGHLAFCIDPLKIVGSDYIVNNQMIDNYYTEEEQRMIQLIIHYGAATHQDDPYYYMASQELIWRINNKGDYYFTTTNSIDGERIDIEFYKTEIMEKVNKHDILPSFGNQTLYPKVYDKIVLEDENDVLDRFFSSFSTRNRVTRQDNLLNIQVVDNVTDIINLTYTVKSGSHSNVYVGSGQTLITSNIDEKQNIKIKIEPVGVSYYFKIVVKERTTGSIFGKVKFKIFDLENSQYLQNGKEYETNYFGTYKSDFKLEPGTYQIVYTEVPNGYISSKTVNVFSISDTIKLDSSLMYTNVSYIDVPLGILNITRDVIKYDGSSYLLDDVEYKIYASSVINNVKGQKLYSADELVATIKTVNGKAEQVLPLGNYYVVEQSNNYGVETHYRENVSFKYDNSITDYYYVNLDITTKLPALNISMNTLKEEINGNYIPFSKFKYGLFAHEDIVYLGEIVLKKGDFIAEFYTDNNGIFNSIVNIPYGTYEIRELTTDDNYYANESIIFEFDRSNNNIGRVEYKKLKRGNLIVKVSSDGIITGKLKFIYDNEYNYEITNELLIENIKIGYYKVIYDKEYSVTIKDNETTILEIVIIKNKQETNIEDNDEDNENNQNNSDNPLDNENVKDDKDTEDKEEINTSEEDLSNDKQEQLEEEIKVDTEIDIVNNDIRKENSNNDVLIKQDYSDGNLIIEELPNATNYLKRYCYIFEIFLIAGIILKLSAKKN